MAPLRPDGGTDDDGDGDSDAQRCEACGQSLAEATHRRVVSAVDEDQVVHHQFCTEACLETWLE